MNRVETQIAEAMASTARPSGAEVEAEIEVPAHPVENGVIESSGSPSAPPQNAIRVDVSEQVDESDSFMSEGKSDDNEIVYVDGKFGVVALSSWDELVDCTEHTERESSPAASVPRPVSVCGMRSDMREVVGEEAGPTYTGLRRSSSCSNLYEIARTIKPSTSGSDSAKDTGDVCLPANFRFELESMFLRNI